MTPAQFYNMSVTGVARLATPRYLRVGVLWNWIVAIVSATVGYLNTEFLNFRNATIVTIGYDGSVVSLEHLLNLRYYGVWDASDTTPPIFITGRTGERPTYLYPVADALSPFLFPVPDSPILLFPVAELGTTFFDFTINVPNTLVFTVAEMRALVNRYKVAGPTYNIVTY